MAALPTDALGDLFLLYSNAVRQRKVVLGAIDTMYTCRLSTARTSDALRAFSPAAAAAGAGAVTAGAGLDSINRAGFARLLSDCAGLLDGLSIDVNYVFMENLGACNSRTFASCAAPAPRRASTLARAAAAAAAARPAGDPTPRRRRFELSFDQFLDALAAVAVAKYPSMAATPALMTLYERYLRPLYALRFSVAAPAAGAGAALGGSVGDENGGGGGGGGDGGSVVVSVVSGGGLARTTTVRRSRVVLTPRGVAPAFSDEAAGAAVPLVVGTHVTAAVLTGAVGLLPGASGAGSVVDAGAPDAGGAVLRRKTTTHIGSADSAVAAHQVAAAGGASATGISPRRAASLVSGSGASALSGADFIAPLSPPPMRSPPPPMRSPPLAGAVAAARRPVPSAFSIDPYSREARGTGGADGVLASPEALQQQTDMISELVDAASDLQRELAALRLENEKLRAGGGV